MKTASHDTARRPVGFCRCRPDHAIASHDHASKLQLTAWLAELLGSEHLGEVDVNAPPAGPWLAVPDDTLPTLEHARRLGITGAADVFGGVVPAPFVATKVITHPLIAAGAPAPAGWSARFPQEVREVVLPGYSVFSAENALTAGERLLREGPVRLKQADGVGGAGQHVVARGKALQAVVAALDPQALAREGVVLERNLANVTTFSVGQVQVGPWLASYWGTQGLVRNHHGHDIYGGSRLNVTRGGYAALLEQPLADDARLAVQRALVYHAQAAACFPGLLATRSNYDIVLGTDEAGRSRCGVLEQSWRMGGATGAELLALFAFRDRPEVRSVVATTHEVYADDATVPPGARLIYDGPDATASGRLVKFATLESDGNT